jgi:DNA repair protein RecO (recombination protein O)
LKLAAILGFEPSIPEDLLLGTGNSEDRAIAKKFLDANYDDEIIIASNTRRSLLDAILKFYEFHIENFGQVKSLKILKEIL